MPAFRQRPLTWLFFIATACLDAVALTAWRDVDWYNVLFTSEVMIVGGWFVLGRSHRLARCAGVIAVILAVTAPDYYRSPGFLLRDYRPIGTWFGTWRYVMGAFLLIVAATVGFTWLTSIATRIRRSTGVAKRQIWQFPLAEIFGWMIVVAVSAATLPYARFDFLTEPPVRLRSVALWLGAPALAGIAMGALLPVGEFHLKPRRRVAGSLIVAFFIALFIADMREDRGYIAMATAYVGLWIAVQWLDERGIRSVESNPAPG